MKRSMASSRCYELLGQYNRALIVLYENDYFDMAIDTLRRYKMLMQVVEDLMSAPLVADIEDLT